MAENYIDAEKDYIAGMKYKDIAEKYGVSLNTVKSWKQRYEWSRDKKSVHTKKEKVCTQNKKSAPASARQEDDGTVETLLNDELTPEQQMFCIYYIRTFNATQSYMKAFNCTYNTAHAKGYALVAKAGIKEEIERLKEIKRRQIVAGPEDIVELQMRIAFGDIGGVLQFNARGVSLNNSTEVDTQLIASVKEGKDGVSVKMKDSQKAIDWLSKYFLMHPDDKYKAEFDRRRAEMNDNSGEEILKNMQAMTDILKTPEKNRTIEDYEEDDKENEE